MEKASETKVMGRLTNEYQPAEITVLKPDGEQTSIRGGILHAVQGLSSSQVLEKIKENTRENLDYFIFEETPQKEGVSSADSIVYVFVAEADKFTLDDTPPEIKFFKKDMLGTLKNTQAKFVDVIDHKWTKKVGDIEIKVEGSEGRDLIEHEKRLAKSFESGLRDRLGSKVVNETEILAAVNETAEELCELTWNFSISPNTYVETTDGDEQSSGIRVSVTLIPTPTRVDLSELPEDSRARIRDIVDKEMQRIFQEHPLIMGQRDSDISGIDNGRFRYNLIMEEKDGVFSWRYPPNVPAFRDSWIDDVAGVLQPKPVDSVPSPSAGALMPIPTSVKTRIDLEISEEFMNLPGYLKGGTGQTTDGALVLDYKKLDFPQFLIPPSVVEDVKKEMDIDLSLESAELEKGARDWSLADHNKFFDDLVKKFKAHGYQLSGEEKDYLIPESGNRMFIAPGKKSFRQLIEPSKLIIKGDLDLPGIGGKDAIGKILGSEPMTDSEFDKKLAEVEALYHKAGYLLMGESVHMFSAENRGQIAPILQLKKAVSKSGKVVVLIEVVRAANIKINGKIREESKQALLDAVRIDKGEAVNFADFSNHLRNALYTLQLKEKDGEIKYIVNENDTLDIVVNLEEPMLTARAEVGANAEVAEVNGYVGLPHMVPGLTSIGVGANASYYTTPTDAKGREADLYRHYADKRLSYGAYLLFETLPLNSQGVRIGNKVGYSEAPYIYRNEAGQIVEIGRSYLTSDSATLYIPLGSDGIAGPYELTTGVNGSVEYHDGENPSGGETDRTITRIGQKVAIRALYGSQAFDRDTVIVQLGTRFDENLTDDTADTTPRQALTYTVPVWGPVIFEFNESAMKRIPLNTDALPVDRLLNQSSIQSVDFGRSFGDPYGLDYYLYGGAFLALRNNPFVNPMIGASLSSSQAGGSVAGAGVALQIPLVGLTIYLGKNSKGETVWGLGGLNSRELY